MVVRRVAVTKVIVMAGFGCYLDTSVKRNPQLKNCLYKTGL